MFKSIVLHERRPELTRADFMRHWLKVHAPMSAGARDLHGYVCHEVMREIALPGMPKLMLQAAIDGIAQMWFETPDGLLTLPNQPSVKTWFADGPNFIGRRVRFMGEEQVLVRPQRLAGATPKLIAFLARATGSEPAAFRRTLSEQAQAAAERLPGCGLTASHIVGNHPTSSITGFPMGAIDSVLELWLRSDDDASASSWLQETLSSAPRECALSGVRVFATAETVIRPPAQ